jgi:hypothetical protein
VIEHAYINDDVLLACVDLVGRAGASGFEIGYLHEDVPVEDAGWYAYATYHGARITVEDHRSPTGAALALAERLLRGAMCRCRRPVALSDRADGCRWRLLGKRWEPGCDAEPLHIKGERGDHAAIQRALAQPANRAERRARRKGA